MAELQYKRDDSRNRYLVYLGDDRIGFVKKLGDGAYWNAVDTFMDKDRDFRTRNAAGAWLKREFERAVRENRA